MKHDTKLNETSLNDCETRNPWQAPEVEVLEVDQTEDSQNSGSDLGIFS